MITDEWNGFSIERIFDYPIWKLLSKYWKLELSDTPDFLFYGPYNNNYLNYDCLRIFITGENVRPQFNHCDYAFSFDYPISERNYRLPIYRWYSSNYEKLLIKRNPEQVLREKREFCSFLVSNPDPHERIQFFHSLSSYKKVDSGGKVLNNIGKSIENKLEWMNNYKFCIAFENSSFPGYTTEKLMNALIANTIPIYWGNPLVSQEFNPKAFINCNDYQNFNDVIEVVKNIDNDDDLYLEYLSQPYLPNNVEVEYLKEEKIIERFDEIFTNKIIFIPPSIKKSHKIVFLTLKVKKKIIRVIERLMQSILPTKKKRNF